LVLSMFVFLAVSTGFQYPGGDPYHCAGEIFGGCWGPW